MDLTFLFSIYSAKMITLEKLKQLRLIHLCIAITFFTSGLTVNFIQLVLHIFLKPFNKRLFRHLMYYLCYSFYCRKYHLTPLQLFSHF